MNTHKITLYTAPDCGLCDKARTAVEETASSHDITVEEVDITVNPVLKKRYSSQIPVLHVDGKPHDFWTIDKERLKRALEN